MFGQWPNQSEAHLCLGHCFPPKFHRDLQLLILFHQNPNQDIFVNLHLLLLWCPIPDRSLHQPKRMSSKCFLKKSKPSIQGLLRPLQTINSKENSCLPNLRLHIIFHRDLQLLILSHQNPNQDIFVNLHLLPLWYLILDRWPQVEPLAYPFF